MPESDATTSSPVRVDYSTFDLADSGRHTAMGSRPENGLIYSASGHAVICTGIHSGWVNVTVTARQYPPIDVDTDAWDEVVDHSVESLTGTLHVASVMAPPAPLPRLTPHGSGPYRVRVHARGRDLAPDGAPSEDYPLITWPASPGSDDIHKSTDRHGEQLRRSPHWPPPPPVSNQEDDMRRMLRERIEESARRANQPPEG